MIRTIVKRHSIQDSNIFQGQLLHPIIQRLYLNRGVDSLEQVNYKLSRLLHPDALNDLSKASKLLINAVKHKKKIVIVGDFDADGATSTALALRCLQEFGSLNHDYLVPNRFDYGYGLSCKLVGELKKMNADVIVTVDNGISSLNGVNAAKQAGMQVVVTDHHLPGQELPNADAIVNPNSVGDNFASKNLAGVGVVFYLMAQMRRDLSAENWFSEKGINPPKMARFLDLVALGTVADMVPLDVNNRIMVAQGLRQIRKGNTLTGIKALIRLSGKKLESIDESVFSFVLAPRLNAAGRLQDMSVGIDLLLTNDMSMALKLAEQLEQMNVQRKEIQEEMQQFANGVVKQLKQKNKLPSALCLFHSDWHQGVVGLLATKVREKTHRPVIAFARENTDSTVLKGSARSVEGLHIRDVLVDINRQNPEMIKKFGGHAMAAGLSIEEHFLNDFQRLFNQCVEQSLGVAKDVRTIYSDGSIDSDDLSVRLAELIEQSGPWGQQFQTPIFDDWFIVHEKKMVGGAHTQLSLQTADQRKKIRSIAFSFHPEDFPPEGKNVHICYSPTVNDFRGKRNLQLLIHAIVQ